MEWCEKLAAVDRKANRGSPTKRARVRSPGPRRASTHAENVVRGQNVRKTDKPGALETLNARTGLARLGSVTNIAASHSPSRLVSQHTTHSPPPTPRRAVKDAPHLLTTPPILAIEYGLRTPQPSPFRQMQALPTSPGPPHTTIGRAVIEMARSDPPTSLLRTLSPEPKDNTLVSPSSSLSTLHQYLQDAVVWMARPPVTPRPLWRAPSHTVIPTGNQVNSIDALALACGWDCVTPCSWAKRGIVFVDDSEVTSAYTAQVLGSLAKRRSMLVEERNERNCRPIFILSTKMLAYDALDQTMTGEELEARVICRFG